MTFNSLDYAVFLAIVVAAYWLLRRWQAAGISVLLGASYVFYMCWDWRYAGLIFLSTIVDYVIGRLMALQPPGRKKVALLCISLICNLGLLAFFKYLFFFAGTTASILAFANVEVTFDFPHFLLPVGISFYTFQTLSYTIDVYRGRLKPEQSFLRFALFVSFFPQLVAGPIVRAADFLPQLKTLPSIRGERVQSGCLLFCQGLIKKVVLADVLAAMIVDPVFETPGDFSFLARMLAVYAYAFQIYNDFSGYSDMAIGTAQMLGFQLPKNFARPYLSSSIQEFWSRWHISLSTWLRDYLYIPLGGNRKGSFRTNVNLLLTMLLGGLWHGAAMNFVLWGAYHGGLLVVHRQLFGRRKEHPGVVSTLRLVIGVLLTFHFVLFGWLLFRVTSMENFSEMIRWQGAGTEQISVFAVCWLLFAAILHPFSDDVLDRVRIKMAVRCPAVFLGVLYAAVVLIAVACTLDAPSFIYFQF